MRKWLANARPSAKAIGVLILTYLSGLFARSANLYLFIDRSNHLQDDNEAKKRLLYYLGGGETVRVVWANASDRVTFQIKDDQILDVIPCPLMLRCKAFLFGRVLLAHANPRNIFLQRVFSFKFFVVDWQTGGYRDSTWRWLAASSKMTLPRAKEIWSAANFRGEEVVVMGTGPSAALIFEEPYRSMPLITCNTALKSERLRQHEIAAFCIADALYFLAPTDYGKKFQGMLKTALAEKQFPIVINASFYDFCLRRMPFIPKELLLPVFINGHFRSNVQLIQNPTIPNASSVFPQLMLPLAINCFKRIHLVGFDGKDPNMKNYFWKHSDEFQYEAELPSVKLHDPGSFGERAPDFYDKYNQHYSSEIDALLSVARGLGREVHMAHSSFVPALKRLYEAERLGPVSASEG